VAFAGLTLSPDGKWLVYAETGDDGYSRLFAVPAAGGAPVTLSPRYDGYALSWSADGTELFFVEGNAIQGEATRVSAVHPDGTAHRIVVEGGGL
jgi:Tol biopolymer transport system component